MERKSASDPMNSADSKEENANHDSKMHIIKSSQHDVKGR